MYESEIAIMGTGTYRCFDSLHQVMIANVPHIPMPVVDHNDILQLIYEPLRTIQLMKTPPSTNA